MRPVDLFHIGPQKSGTTWIYNCLKEHPEITTSPDDTIHFFDMNYHRGEAWFLDHFAASSPSQKIFDPTYSYIRSPLAPKRIKAHNPKALIALTMRHPVSRAFSHYWHEKKKGRYNFTFEEIMSNYDLFANWVEPGFYAVHIERLLEHFPISQILPQDYDHMCNAPSDFLRELLEFYGITTDFEPRVIDKRLNEAKPTENHSKKQFKAFASRAGKSTLKNIGLGKTIPYLNEIKNASSVAHPENRNRQKGMEYLSDQPQALLEDLIAACEPEINHLEKLLELDFSSWRSLKALQC